MSAKLPSQLPVLPREIGSQSLSWQWTQSIGDSTHIEASAEGFSQASDGLETDLRGVVLKIFRGDAGTHDRIDSAAMRMVAGGDLYSEGETVIRFGVGDGREGAAAVVAYASGVTFHLEANRARTDRLVRYEFSDGEGSSIGAVYDAAAATIELLSQVAIERGSGSPGAPATSIRAGRLLYAEAGSTVEVSGGARIERGSQWLECEKGVVLLAGGRIRRASCTGSQAGDAEASRESRFEAARMEAEFGAGGELLRVQGRGGARLESGGPGQRLEVRGAGIDLDYQSAGPGGGSFLRQVEARGAARARMKPESGSVRNSLESEALAIRLCGGSAQVELVETLDRGRMVQSAEGADGGSRALEADRLRLAYGESGGLESLTARGDARSVQSGSRPGSAALRTWSDELEASIDPGTAEISGLRQTGSFRFDDGAASGTADTARFDLGRSTLELMGDATLTDPGGSVRAERVSYESASGRLEARGAVTGSLVPGGPPDGEPTPSGLFESQLPMYFAAGVLSTDPERQVVEYRRRARLWQGRNRIDADALSIHQTGSWVRADGEVFVAWEDAEPGGAAAVKSCRMTYESGSGIARFDGQVEFRRAGMIAYSDELETGLGGGARNAVAVGWVRIDATAPGSGHRGSGDRAEFGLADSTVVLTGRPAWVEAPDGTRSEGGRLTYRATGDSLQVQGHGAERAYTYRPASR